jgi:hypothetical protein
VSTDGLVHGADDVGTSSGPIPGTGEYEPMPPVIGPAVAVEDALVVLRRRHRHRALAVAQGQQRQLLALEVLLDHHALGPVPALHEQRPRALARRALVGRDHHAPSRPQPVGLDHVG